MKNIITAIASATFIITGCQSVAPTEPSASQASNTNAQSDDGAQLKRFPPRYPLNAARQGKEGCATIGYTLTPTRQITDIQIIDSSANGFATEAMAVIPKWNWSEYTGPVPEAINLHTRFEFCLEDGSGRCSPEMLAARTNCPGNDVIISAGSVIKKQRG